MRVARKSDWQTHDMPERHSTITLTRRFEPHEMELIQFGLIPEDMGDKWFVYWQEDTLYLHRSWTGFCIYVVRFTRESERFQMTEADLNRDAEQYSQTHDRYDAKMIEYLIDTLLLHQDVEYPIEDDESGEASDPGKVALQQWSQIGRAMLGDHPTQE